MSRNNFDQSLADDFEELTLSQIDAEDENLNNKMLTDQSVDDLDDELSQFRLEWKQELLQQQQQSGAKDNKMFKPSNDDILDTKNERKAEYLFNKGVLLEQQGRLYEAVKFYRMAMQIDKDIEFKSNKKQIEQQQASIEEKKNFKNEDDEDLYDRFQTMILNDENNQLCQKQFQQKGTHFSNLPFEVIIYILKWVASEDLDLRSIDIFSTVCKGFYVCSRDPEIWKLACEKIWRSNTGSYTLYGNSWRDMYLNRPRLNFDGCYICKSSYIRSGEQSLDSFYRPWHLVEYYRFLRFFPDGSVLMLTTPEEPKLSVSKLKQKQTREMTILKGHWSINSQLVSIILIKKIFKQEVRKGRRGAKEVLVNQEQFYNMELEVTSIGRRSNNQLSWISYDLHIINKLTNSESTTEFEMNKIDFPPFHYSRVKSYMSNSEVPLK